MTEAECYTIQYKEDFFAFPTLDMADDMKFDIKLYYQDDVKIVPMTWAEANAEGRR